MADTTTTSNNTIHWILYPVLAAVIGLVVWLWHDTQVHDAAVIQAVATAKSNQTTVDKQATVTISQADKNLQTQNEALQATLAKAKSTAQQIALINQDAGTHLSIQPAVDNSSQATNPSQGAPVVTIAPEDVPVIAKQTVDFKEALNQVAADKLVIASETQELDACNSTQQAQDKEITTLKGGSHFKKFLKAAEYVAIGAGVGYVAGKKF
jgi:hypothetical protein